MEFDFGVCALADYDEDGFPQIQIDTPAEDPESGTSPVPALTPPGYYARPLDPDRGANGEVGLGADVLYLTVGSRRYAIPFNDPRDINEGQVPRVKKGGRMIVGGAGELRSFFMIDGEDPNGEKAAGSIMLSAQYGTAAAKKSLSFSMNVRDDGTEDISLIHGDGARITIDKNGTTVTAPNGKHYIDINSKGNVLAGKTKVQGALTVGEQLAAQGVIKGPEFVALMTKFINIVATIVGTSGAGAPAAALIPELGALLTQHLKAT